MIVEQIYTGCLAQGAYYIESQGEAIIIDPLREVTPYINKAQRNGAVIKYILETHFHADFVSGHLDLSKKTGAPIVYGPNANPEFEAYIAKDGEILTLGNIKIKVLHTPGHTLESTCYLLIDEAGKEKYIFTGDTLFIGDVGRPDLAQKSNEITKEDLAGMLFDSLNNKIKTLPDEVIVYPAHGAGSACGKNMSKETFDTLGNQKKTNYALLAEDKATFIQEVTDGLMPPPYYFPQNAMLNKKGYSTLDEVMHKGHQPLTPEAVELLVSTQDALILDTRAPQSFAEGHIPGSIFIGIKGDFAPWVGTLITDIKQNLILVADDDSIQEVLIRLSRVGYDNTLGYLEGGIKAWKAAGKAIDTVNEISAQALADELHAEEEEFIVVDVRKDGEYNAEHLKNVKHASLAFINENLDKFQADAPIYVHCAGGYRSMIAISILKARGIHNLVNVQGGFNALKNTGIEMEGNGGGTCGTAACSLKK